MATAYFARSVKLTADAARVLGKSEDAEKLDTLFEEIKAAFNKAFVAPDGRIKGNTQTVYVLAIWFGLLSEENEKTAARYLVEDIQSRGNHLSTGFNGTAYLMPTLAKTGNNATAYKLLLNDTFPSWGYTIKHGATSIWERWDGLDRRQGLSRPGHEQFCPLLVRCRCPLDVPVSCRHRHGRPGLQTAADCTMSRPRLNLGKSRLRFDPWPHTERLANGKRKPRHGRYHPGQHHGHDRRALWAIRKKSQKAEGRWPMPRVSRLYRPQTVKSF